MPAGLHFNRNVDSVACCHLTLPLPLPLLSKTPQRRRPIKPRELVAKSKDYLILNVHFAQQSGGATIFRCIGTGTGPIILDDQKDVHRRRAPWRRALFLHLPCSMCCHFKFAIPRVLYVCELSFEGIEIRKWITKTKDNVAHRQNVKQWNVMQHSISSIHLQESARLFTNFEGAGHNGWLF